MLKILTVPEATEILRTKSRPVMKIDAELLAFLRELGETLKGQKDPAGVGLSAIQVGRPIRAFAMFLPEERDTESKGPTLPRQGRTLSKSKITFYVNPEIAEHAAQMTLGPQKESYFAPPAHSYAVAGGALAKSDPSGFGRTNGFLQNKNPGPSEKNKNGRPFLEGCLSIPKIYGPVLRWPWIKAKAIVIEEELPFFDGGRQEKRSGFAGTVLTMEGLGGRVFQHEMDHLNGILFTDHVLAQGNKLFREEGREMVEMAM